MHDIQQTTLLAYKELVGDRRELGRRQREVYRCIRENQPLNNLEISRMVGRPINCITGRVNELRKKGLVTFSHTAPCKYTGKQTMYWRTQ